MPQFIYRGRDKEGHLFTGERAAENPDNLNSELIKQGITAIEIILKQEKNSYLEQLSNWLQIDKLQVEELAVFTRQMQLLHKAGVPLVIAIKQLAAYTRNRKLANALRGVVENIEKGQSLSSSMQQYSKIFSPLMINIIQIGENTGHLSEAFGHIHEYLAFESRTTKQIKSTFRYPLFMLIIMIGALFALNIFVIPTFSRFYANFDVSLPWQTRLLIGISHFFVHYGLYSAMFILLAGMFIIQYLRTPQGKYQLHKYLLKTPFIASLLRHIFLVRFCESLSIILNSGLQLAPGLTLVKNTISNTYLIEEINNVQQALARGVPFTQAISHFKLFSLLEIQILAVGEQNGELSPALNYISHFHSQEIEYDLKKANDFIGPFLIGIIAVLILIVALGIYLPVWNMISLIRTS